MSEKEKDFVHVELDKEITAIGGHYVLTKEVRLPYQNREILYLAGYAVYDTTCCGAGGCGYALVAGYIENWKYKTNGNGQAVTKTEPITDKNIQQDVRTLIEKSELVNQVRFD